VSAPDDTTHAIFDEGDLRKYRTEIPNMVYDIGLTPYEGWLYGHFKRVCGAKPDGMCWKSVATLAKETGMSTGRVSEARRELERRGLIKMEQPKGPGTSITVTIVDIWPQNMARYMTPSQYEGPPSRGEDPPSRGEPKKEPFKKKPFKNSANSEKRRKEGYEWLFDR
jgi:Helix-turn-helix domain